MFPFILGLIVGTIAVVLKQMKEDEDTPDEMK